MARESLEVPAATCEFYPALIDDYKALEYLHYGDDTLAESQYKKFLKDTVELLSRWSKAHWLWLSISISRDSTSQKTGSFSRQFFNNQFRLNLVTPWYVYNYIDRYFDDLYNTR